MVIIVTGMLAVGHAQEFEEFATLVQLKLLLAYGVLENILGIIVIIVDQKR